MDVCINLNYFLVIALIAALIIAGVILFPLLFGKKINAAGEVKMGFISLWWNRLRALLRGDVEVEIDWNIDGEYSVDKDNKKKN